MDATTLATEKRDDVIVRLMDEQGLSLNAAIKRYVELRKEHGLHVGVVSKKEDAFELFNGGLSGSEIDPRVWVKRLTEELEVSEGAARDYIKAYAAEHGLSVKRGAQSEEVIDWIVAHAPHSPDADWDEFDKEFVERWYGTRSKANINEYRKGIALHRRLIAR